MYSQGRMYVNSAQFSTSSSPPLSPHLQPKAHSVIAHINTLISHTIIMLYEPFISLLQK